MDNGCFKDKHAKMLVDTGSQLNVIKESALDPETVVNTKVIVHITGVGKGLIRTYGEVTMNFKNLFTKLHVVDDSFPIREDGILGVPFLRSQDAKLIIGDVEIPFSQEMEYPSFDLPPRTKKFIKIPVANKEIQEGYMKRMDTGGGIYLGECLVTQKDGAVQVLAVNSTETQVKLTIPPVELEQFYEINPIQQKFDFLDPDIDKDKAAAERLSKLNELFALEGLNNEEKLSIMAAVYEFPYQFHLLGDKLGSTKVVKH